MDSKDFELYAQENKRLMLETKQVLLDLKTLLDVKLPQQINTPDNINVTGTVSINNQLEAVELSNISLIKTWQREQTDAITRAIVLNKTIPVTKITVENIAEAHSKTIAINNIKEFASQLVKELVPIVKGIENIKPVINTTKTELPTDHE
jgi:hypothetical protein